MNHEDFNHIKYTGRDVSVCQEPVILRTSWTVVQEHDPAKPYCRECGDLLVAHNARTFEKEAATPLEFTTIREKLGPARGVVYGIAFSSAFWLMLGLLALLIWKWPF